MPDWLGWIWWGTVAHRQQKSVFFAVPFIFKNSNRQVQENQTIKCLSTKVDSDQLSSFAKMKPQSWLLGRLWSESFRSVADLLNKRFCNVDTQPGFVEIYHNLPFEINQSTWPENVGYSIWPVKYGRYILRIHFGCCIWPVHLGPFIFEVLFFQ